MRAKSIFLLLLALGCGLVASIGITQVMAKRDVDPPVPAGEQDTVLVAIKEIAMGDPITPQVVKLEPWPKNLVPDGAMTRWEDVEGRRTKTTIVPGSPISESQLLGKGVSVTGPSALIPVGYRAFTVKVDAAGNAGIIRPRDRVDVLVHVKPDSQRAIKKSSTLTILQDVSVFDVNGRWDMDAAAEDKLPSVRTVSLLVTPQEAEVLTLANELGNLRLVLRSPADKGRSKLAGLKPEDLVAQDPSGRDREPNVPIPTESGDGASPDILKTLQGLMSGQTGEPSAETAQPAPPPTPPAAPPPEIPKKETVSVRIIVGTEVKDVVLESPVPRDAGGASATDLPFWKINPVNSPSPSSAAGRGAEAPALKLPALPATKPPVKDGDDASTHDKGKENRVRARANSAQEDERLPE